MRQFLILSISILFLSAGCNERDDNAKTINIRVKNTNSFIYDTVQVGGEETVHLDVETGKYSGYLEYETAYRYAYIKIEANGGSYILQPIDFVGETPLAIGFYTYELHVDGEGNIALDFVID